MQLIGRHRLVDYRLNAALGYRQFEFPIGLVLTGTGDPDDEILNVMGGSTVASYDSSNGPLDMSNPGSNVGIFADGSGSVTGSSTIYGEVNVSGSLTTSGSGSVQGSTSEGVPPIVPEGITDFALEKISEAQATNDNGNLGAVFGSGWSPVPGPGGSGDLSLSGGTYVVPAGTYVIRKFSLTNDTKIIFDTSGGPTTLVFEGFGPDAGAFSSLRVTNSTVQVDPDSTTNGLLVVMAPERDLKLTAGSIFGQSVRNLNSGGFTQVISAGADGTADLIDLSGDSIGYGRLYAPQHDIEITGNSAWYGSAIARTFRLGGSTPGPAVFGVDEDLQGTALTDPTNFEIHARWPATY